MWLSTLTVRSALAKNPLTLEVIIFEKIPSHQPVAIRARFEACCFVVVLQLALIDKLKTHTVRGIFDVMLIRLVG